MLFDTLCSALGLPEVGHEVLESIGVNVSNGGFPVVHVVNKVLYGDLAIAALESEAFAESLNLLRNGLLAGRNGGISLPVALFK